MPDGKVTLHGILLPAPLILLLLRFQGMDLRPPPLDVSALICDCAIPGLKVDPTDSVLSSVSLVSPYQAVPCMLKLCERLIALCACMVLERVG